MALAAPGAAWARDVEVVVRLDAPGLAEARSASRALTPAAKHERLDLGAPSSRAYLAALDAAQRRFAAAIARVPGARISWRYRIVLNAVAVVAPDRSLPRLAALPGVRDVLPNARFSLALDRSPAAIGAPSLWNDPLQPTRGDGLKIGILDDGIDHTHPFFAPAGFTMPAGFPKGNARFTTAKVIAARAFPPPGAAWRYANDPFDPELSGHGTHVAGIAAGNAGTRTTLGFVVSGVAPRAQLGNYRVMTVPSEAFGLNGNAPEIVRGIEAAVADGMDVINLSLGEPEVEPSRDVVALALDAAAAVGVVPVVSAGNAGRELGTGSVGSPGSSRAAITVGAAATDERVELAGFSSLGPTPLSFRLKPEVVAPGVSIASSAPGPSWELSSGTSMAAPHVAGAAALLLQRNPAWTPAQVKSALVTTGRPLAPIVAAGGGLVQLAAAAQPRIFAEPAVVSFGIVRPGAALRATVALADAGGGAGRWVVSAPAGTLEQTVPGTLLLTLRAPQDEGIFSGTVGLSGAGVTRRIPYAGFVTRPDLPRPSFVVRRAGVFRGSTVSRSARVRRYRFPDVPRQSLAGPEQVVRIVLRRAAANVGVAVLSGGVEPRIVRSLDENRLAGVAALPRNTNPYHRGFDRYTKVAAVTRPLAGAYDVVFDSRTVRGSRFAFRVWIDDTRPPTLRLVRTNAVHGTVLVRAADGGSGVDPSSITARIGAQLLPVRYTRGIVRIDVRSVRRGRHVLVVRVSDRQETKNDENVAGVLPNTRQLRAAIRVP